MIYSEIFEIETGKRFEIINITEKVNEIVRKSKVTKGLCFIFLPHATCTLILNEDEPNVREDYLRIIKELFVRKDYKHDRIDDNAHAHVTSAITKPFLILPIENGKLLRGAWQEIMLLEIDGPRRRRIYVQIQGE